MGEVGIKRIKYFHGTGLAAASDLPEELLVAVSVGPSLVTKGLVRSFEKERIGELSGQYGDRTAGDPIEVDRLEVETAERSIAVTVFNRGVAMLSANSDEIGRLHRFFGVIEEELARGS